MRRRNLRELCRLAVVLVELVALVALVELVALLALLAHALQQKLSPLLQRMRLQRVLLSLSLTQLKSKTIAPTCRYLCRGLRLARLQKRMHGSNWT
jgi:hypothetical protein